MSNELKAFPAARKPLRVELKPRGGAYSDELWYPSVDENGVLTWTLSTSRTPPEPAEIGHDKHYFYEQAQPSDSWLIEHNLGKYPSVSIVDTANTEVVGDVEYIDTNSLRVTFANPFAGYAYLN